MGEDLFFYDMMLRHWVIGSRRFEADLMNMLQGSDSECHVTEEQNSEPYVD